MRVALLYPPPWKIAAGGEPPYASGEGAPADYQEGDLDADFWQVPYGLLSLGAQARRAGHRVQLVNLSAFPWTQVEAFIAGLDAEVFGLSCWTANRRGVDFTARLVRQTHPGAHIMVGGPHATPLGRELLEHSPAIDTVAVGEGEATFMELLDRLAAGEPAVGIAGTYFRGPGGVESGPARPAIADLDTLASVHDYYDTHIVMTSRGCPWQCTFCGAETTWGRGFRGQSVAYVLDALQAALERAPVRMLQIKDDTFTTNKRRVLELCRGIRQRGLNFLWSCDTRVDVLTEELLYEMRLAGCERLSLGVESGSPAILGAINKKITVEKILSSTELAKRFGIQVRYYMMLGNRGETEATFRQTLEFLERAQPHQYIFSCLSIYPGTEDFHDAERAGWLDRRVYFEQDFQELKVPFDASEEVTRVMMAWFREHSGLQNLFKESAAQCSEILERLGEHPAAHLALAGAYWREGDVAGCQRHAQKALELGYPAPGLAYNYLACVAAQRRDLSGLEANLKLALRKDPMHYAVAANAKRVQAWVSAGGPVRGLPLELLPQDEFQVFEKTRQPALPGPVADPNGNWEQERPPSGEQPHRRRDQVGSRAAFRGGRLRVLS